MSELKYRLSFFAYVLQIKITKRKWYKFWGEDERYEYMVWVRYSMMINEAEYQLLAGDFKHPAEIPAWSLVWRALAGVDIDNIKNVQIEDVTHLSSNMVVFGVDKQRGR